MRVKGETPAQVIGRTAGRAHGVVTREELLNAGLSRQQIQRRLQRGELTRLHRGVYLVGHSSPGREATYMAATKACGAGATLAGMAAAHVWGLVRGSPPEPEVIARGRRRVTGVTVHHGRAHASCDITKRRGIPLTTVQRTLVDIAASLTEPALARVFHHANVLWDNPGSR